MNLDERMNALFAWMDEPASAGFNSPAAQRVLGMEEAARAEQEAKAEAEMLVREQLDGQNPAADPVSGQGPEAAPRPEGRTAMQAEYDITSLRRECFGQQVVSSVHSRDLSRAEDAWQAKKAVEMTPGQLDLLLRTQWSRLSERQRAEMTSLQQCGQVPDQEMARFLYAVATLSELVSSREVKRLMDELHPLASQSHPWRAMYVALMQRLVASDEVARRHIERVDEQIRMREEAYRQAAAAYSRAQAERRRIQNSYF